MTDIHNSDWNEQDSANVNPSPNGIQGGYAPSTLGPTIRAIRGAQKRNFVQQTPIYTTSGTANSYVLTFVQGPTAYYKGQVFRFWCHADNTGAATLNINSLGAKSILSTQGETLTAGQLRAGKVVQVVYNSTSFELLDVPANNPKFTGTLVANNTNVTGTFGANNASLTGTLSANTVSANTVKITDSTPKITLSQTDSLFGAAITVDGNESTAALKVFADTNGDGTPESAVLSVPLDSGDMLFGTNRVWHEGNDGTGSGLDADLLDGQQGSYYKEMQNIVGFTGAVMYFAQQTAPVGFLECNGAAVSRTTYAALFAAIGTLYGSGNGSTTFNLPDLRGEFIRGWDASRGADPARAFGSAQNHSIQSHKHVVDPPSTNTNSYSHVHSINPPSTTTSSDTHSHTFLIYEQSGSGAGSRPVRGAAYSETRSITTSSDSHSHTVNIAAFNSASDTHSHSVNIAPFDSENTGDAETRPRNVALLACIKT